MLAGNARKRGELHDAGLLPFVERVQQGKLLADPGDRLDPLEVRRDNAGRLSADLPDELAQERDVASPGQGVQRGQRRVGIRQIGEQQPGRRRARAIDEQFHERDEVAIDGRLQNAFQHGVFAVGEQDQRLHELPPAMLVELRGGTLQAPEQVLPLELRVAADAVVARGRQLFGQ